MNDIVFIFVINIKHPYLWKDCIRCIRNFYSNKIFIIIDEYDINDNITLNDDNITFIQSEFKDVSDLLPFYYYLLLKPSQKAIIIKDYIFIQKPFNEQEIKEIKDVKFLWHFEKNKTESYNLVLNLLSKLNYDQELLELYINEYKWHGCFELSVIITLEFLEKIQKKYLFLNLIKFIKPNKKITSSLERIFAIICFNELKWNIEHKFKYSLLGNINENLNLQVINCSH